ncbi:MAG TPA: divalent-cation tolerance protein CutA [Candidatus Acidoferrum sp.]|nr:divalent-cation tolerance protein CutA [Candidatus Acidoferrum sp.]
MQKTSASSSSPARSLAVARKIARAVVGKRLAACVNVFLSPVESFYTWKGKLEKTREYLLVIKSSHKRLSDLEKQVKQLHSYEVPEFIVLPITSGSRDYLSWLNKSVAPPDK